MVKAALKKQIVKLLKCNESDFRNILFRYLILDPKGKGKQLQLELQTNPFLRGKCMNAFFNKKLEQLNNVHLVYNKEFTNIDALRYACWLLDLFGEKLNAYIDLRKKFECAYMKKEYETAYSLLDSIDRNLGISLWSCGQRLMLKERKGGLESNKNALTEMANSANKSYIVLCTLFFYSSMAEAGLSYENYQTEFMQFLGDTKETLVGSYLLSKLSFPDIYNEKNISLVIQTDSQYSLVDLYNSFELYLPLVLKSNVCHECGSVDFILPQKIRSSVINNLHMIEYQKKDKICSHLKSHHKIFEIIENYTLGQYESVVHAAIQHLYENPADLQIAILLCKSLICGGIDFPHQESLPEYVKAVYSIYSLDSHYRDAIRELRQTIKICHGSILSLKLYAFLTRKHLEDGDESLTFVSSILDPIIHPNFLRYFQNNSETSEAISNQLLPFCPISIRLAMAVQSGIFNKDELTAIAPAKIDYFIAESFCRKGSYDAALLVADKMVAVYNRSPYFQERLARIYLSAFWGKRDYVKAIKYAVSIFFKNEFLFERINDSGYIKVPKRIKDKFLDSELENVIFRYLIAPSDYPKQISAYSNFLDRNNYSNILEFAEEICSDMNSLQTFFFEKVCSINLLKRDVTIHSLNVSAESARLQILQKLAVAFNSKKYTTEIQNLLTSETTKENLRNINTSRIYADTSKIYNMHRLSWEEVFAKYLALRDADAYYLDIDMTGQKKEQLDALGIRITTQERITQAAIVLKNVISQILEECLFNPQYGLETFLSSRIRHGYCKGQLTTFLSDLHMMSKKKNEDSDEYFIGDYWAQKLTNTSTKTYIENALSNFTRKIENKIEEILTKWLRVKYREESTGIFDYSRFVDFCVNYYYDNKTTDFAIFYNLIIDTFWEYTNRMLVVIKNRIETELTEYYLSAITSLENQLRSINSDSEIVQEMLSYCNLAKAKVILNMKQFTEAFTISNAKYNDFSMEELVASSKKIVEKSHSNSESAFWEVHADSTPLFSGKYFVSFVDILSILLNNAMEHSGFEHYEDLSIEVTIKEIEDRCVDEINMIPQVEIYKHIFCIEVRNNLSKNTDTDLLQRKMSELFSNLTPTQLKRAKIQGEGGTGLYKLYNIAKYNIESCCTIICDVSEGSISVRYNFVADSLLAKEADYENITH